MSKVQFGRRPFESLCYRVFFSFFCCCSKTRHSLDRCCDFVPPTNSLRVNRAVVRPGRRASAWCYRCKVWIPFWLTAIFKHRGARFLCWPLKGYWSVVFLRRKCWKLICFIIKLIIIGITYVINKSGKKIGWVRMSFASLKLLLWSRECFFLQNPDMTWQHFWCLCLTKALLDVTGVFWTLESGRRSVLMTPISGHYQNNAKKGAQRSSFFFANTFLKNYH